MRGSLGYGIDILLTRVIEGAAILPAYIINLANALCTRATTRTVWRDGILQTVAINTPAITDDSLSVAKSGTNVTLQSQSPDTSPWVLRGTAAAVQNLTGADGVSNSGWTLSGIQPTLAGDIYQIISGLVTATRYEPSYILKQIDTVGVLTTVPPVAGSVGLWSIDLSLLSGGWECVDRNHSAVTITTEFDSGTSTGCGHNIRSASGTISVGFFNAQLELGTSSTPQKYTTTGTVTTAADICTSETPSVLAGTWAFELEFDPSATGQSGSVMASYTDVNNYVELITTATTVVLRKRVGGVNYDTAAFSYTHAAGTRARAQMYGGATGTGVRVADSTADITATVFTTNADTADTIWATTINWGHLNGTLSFVGEFYNVSNPTAYSSKEAAQW